MTGAITHRLCNLGRHGAGGDGLRRQMGQALVEGLVVMLVLLSLWVAVAWLARFQDMALQTSHASRFVAFSSVRDPALRPINALRQSYYSGPAQQWRDRRGHEILGAGRHEVTLVVARAGQLPANAQPGASHAEAARLRQEWHLEDQGIVTASVTAAAIPPGADTPDRPGATGSWLRQFDAYYPRLVRHTAILSDAGHAPNDHQVQVRVAQSPLGWGNAYKFSHALGERISSAMIGVDAAWERPDPDFDWLGLWQGAVPEYHLAEVLP